MSLNFSAYARLMRLDKPVGSLLLLWPTLWALWMASNGHISFKLGFIFIIGVFIMRSAGCVLNDIADRDFDPHVERTANRPLASGEVSLKEAFFLLFILLLNALILVLFLNLLCFGLACIGLLITIIYPFMKRWIVAPQAVLGIAFSMGIPMAYAAVDGNLSNVSWLLCVIGVTWPMIYDTHYARVDKDDDLKIGIKSTAILLGKHEFFITSVVECLWFALWIPFAAQLNLNFLFYASLIIAFELCFYQQNMIRVAQSEAGKKEPDFIRQQSFKAFKNHALVGGVLFLGLVLGQNQYLTEYLSALIKH